MRMLKLLIVLIPLFVSMSVKAQESAKDSVELRKWVEETIKSADKGDADRQLQVATWYMSGQYVKQDLTQGFGYFKRAGDGGELEGIYQMGECYLLGRGVELDIKKGIDYITRAAEAGYVPAQTCLGLMYCDGERTEYVSSLMKYVYYPSMLEYMFNMNKGLSVSLEEEPFFVQDNTKGIYWLIRAAEEGNDPYALYDLAIRYESGDNGLKPDNRKVFELLLRAAQLDMAIAQTYIAEYYADGNDGMLEPDDRKAFEWHKRAAENGSVESMCYLGLYYLEGKVTAPDTLLGIESFLNAASYPYNDEEEYVRFGLHKLGYIYCSGQGVESLVEKVIDCLRNGAEKDATIQYNLGYLYSKGIQVPQDMKKACFWFKKAAENDNADAQFAMGQYSAELPIALAWYEKAAEQGHATAQLKLGEYYFYVCTRDLSDRRLKKKYKQKGVYYLQMAAEKGNADAQFYLSLAYGVGEGVRQNRQLADIWCVRAARQGYQRAIDLCRKLNISY